MTTTISGLVTAGVRRRVTATAAALLVGSVGLGACSPSSSEVICPAIGYSSSLTVQLDGDTSDVAEVKLCLDGECAPTDLDSDSLVSAWPPAHEGDSSSWVFVLFDHPEAPSVHALAADGTILADTEVLPDWRRVGGSRECGGPHEATVTVTLQR